MISCDSAACSTSAAGGGLRDRARHERRARRLNGCTYDIPEDPLPPPTSNTASASRTCVDDLALTKSDDEDAGQCHDRSDDHSRGEFFVEQSYGEKDAEHGREHRQG